MTASHDGPTLTITPEQLVGRTGRYEKRLGDLGSLFADKDAYARRRAADGHGHLMYYVDEFRPSDNAGDLITGISTLLPGHVGDEFAMTRGHIHLQQDRTEIYHCLSGHGLMLMETVAGETVVSELTPGVVAYVPPAHIHRSVNLGDEPLVTLFCYPADAGQDYAIISTAHGMRHLVLTDGESWKLTVNSAYVER